MLLVTYGLENGISGPVIHANATPSLELNCDYTSGPKTNNYRCKLRIMFCYYLCKTVNPIFFKNFTTNSKSHPNPPQLFSFYNYFSLTLKLNSSKIWCEVFFQHSCLEQSISEKEFQTLILLSYKHIRTYGIPKCTIWLSSSLQVTANLIMVDSTAVNPNNRKPNCRFCHMT